MSSRRLKVEDFDEILQALLMDERKVSDFLLIGCD
jgi:hypothetical protein